MNAEQRKQTLELIASLKRADTELSSAEVAALLQELIDAPEPEPVGYLFQFNNGNSKFVDGKAEADWISHHLDEAETCTELYTASPVPSVPDEWREAVSNLATELEELIAETSGVYGLHLNGDVSPWGEILEGGRFERITSLHIVQNLLAAQPQPEPLRPAVKLYPPEPVVGKGKPAELLTATNPEQISSSANEPPADLVRDAERLQVAYERLTMRVISFEEWIAAIDKLIEIDAIERDKAKGQS